MERGVLGCAGRTGSEGEAQRYALRRLFVSSFLIGLAPLVTDIYAADTRLADRTAKLATPTDSSAGPGVEHKQSASKEALRTVSSPSVASKQPSQETAPSLTDVLNTTRADLSEAQRSRSELQESLNRANAEFEKLRKKSAQDGRRLKAVDHERLQLQLRLKDRDEELRQKAKLLEVGHALGTLECYVGHWLTRSIQDFQDEIATLNLQLNMADEKSSKLQRENQELVDRWMARMGQEADAMNNASKFS